MPLFIRMYTSQLQHPAINHTKTDFCYYWICFGRRNHTHTVWSLATEYPVGIAPVSPGVTFEHLASVLKYRVVSANWCHGDNLSSSLYVVVPEICLLWRIVKRATLDHKCIFVLFPHQLQAQHSQQTHYTTLWHMHTSFLRLHKPAHIMHINTTC